MEKGKDQPEYGWSKVDKVKADWIELKLIFVGLASV